MKQSEAIRLVVLELNSATSRYGPFRSRHEGYAVVKEEVEELWEEIKGNADDLELTKEAIQAAAMCLRFLVDCCGNSDCGVEGVPKE